MDLIQLRHKHMRRRFAERVLRFLGVRHRRAVQIANRFF